MTSNQAVKLICKSLAEKHGKNIKIIDLSGVSDVADYFVVCSGSSAPQVKAMFDHLEEVMETNNLFARRKEGVTEGRWIAVDYVDVVVHIFHKDARDMYSLDALWSNGANVTDYQE